MNEATTVELDAQYRQLREECGFVERTRGVIAIGGPDGAEYLQGQLTNDIEALEPGAGCYAALLDRKGHMQSDMRVLRLPGGEFRLDLEPGPTPAVLRHLQMYSIGREVEIEDAGERWTVFSAIGPRAADLSGFDGLGPEHAQRVRQWGGIEVLGVATALGVDLFSAADQVDILRELLLEAGAVEVGEGAAEILRIEAGTPRFGHEMGNETMPAEAGIVDTAVSFTKGCYIGQEPVARLHYKGRPNRHLRGLQLSGPVEPGAVLRLGEKEVGKVGSAGVSPARGPVGLAVVRREAEPGAELTVGEAGVTARVVDLPFG